MYAQAPRTEDRMMARKLLIATICLIAASIEPALSEDLTAEKQADIQKLLDMTGAMAIGQQFAEAMIAQMTRALKANRPDLPQKLIDAMRDEVNGVIRDSLPAYTALVHPIYHRYFTHEDIKGMIQFYSTELGQKTIRALPLLMRDGMAAGQQWGQSLQPEIERRVRSRFKAEGVDL